MRTYKRKTDRGKISKEIYEKAAVILEEDKAKKIRGIARDFGLCHMSLTRYLKTRKEAKDKGTPIESVTIGYQKNRQVFDNEQEATLVSYFIKCSQIYGGLTSKDVRQLAFTCALQYNIVMPQSWLDNKEAGVDWLTAFLKRNKSLLIKSEKSIFNDPDAGAIRNFIYNECINFTPEIIQPYSKTDTRPKTKTRKSAILIDTPGKHILSQEQSKKKGKISKVQMPTELGNMNKQEQTIKNTRRKTKKETGKIFVKRKVLHDSQSDEESVEDDLFCLTFCEPFYQSQTDEAHV